MRERPCEPAEGAELGGILQPSDERVGVRQVQDEGGDVGPPKGLERIALASYGSVLLQTGQERIVAQAGENRRQLADGILRRMALQSIV